MLEPAITAEFGLAYPGSRPSQASPLQGTPAVTTPGRQYMGGHPAQLPPRAGFMGMHSVSSHGQGGWGPRLA